MGDIHFQKTLIHRCDIERKVDIQSESGELIPTWTSIDTQRPCRYVEKLERIAQESLGFPMELEHLLLMNNGEDVQVDDQILNIVQDDCTTVVDAGPFTIEQLLIRRTGSAHHISMELERIE